jgi:hypothetical protein
MALATRRLCQLAVNHQRRCSVNGQSTAGQRANGGETAMEDFWLTLA